jgi:hypothetical protein
MSTERRALTHLIGTITSREWRTMQQLVAEGVFCSTEAARKFCVRHKSDLVLGRKGARVLVVDKRSLDRYFEQQGLRSA